ncbi:MAG TPA: ABC transporter ATP-binding protein [Candidatus Thiothrix moscowensis]|uniref:ABC transporter ATP-binding protein n=1 Tax=unclassified Thiothrix TaxID=2636184 RepID=UPI0025ECAB68|nr:MULTISPECIES: ABC transporter ATP-binding protein [unclassified Thiothrix]HRJ51137.1 ABC transporter ATP-binding protein [Candidatus Thiothrix moscowensis]HRJ91808.1 ABC transporter ATP-binding protein [Candidatus Thiothrix moscowensis]
MSVPIIEVRNLRKHYPKVKAVDGVDFAVRQGICFGLLGPNGAGKTTTIEMMEGITRPSSGEILYKGEPQGERFRQEAGIQFQSTALQDFLTVRENLKFFSSLYPKSLPLEELIDICRLRDYLDRDASKLSGGQRQRMLLALALVNDPDVVFLDEPTTGLDPQARLNFWELVNSIKARNKTVLLTTHYMEEAYNLCDEIAIMDHGKIIAHGSPDELLAEHFQDVIIELPERDFPDSAKTIPHRYLDKVNGTVEIITQDVNATLAQLMQHGASLAGLQVRPRTLEDLFLQLTGKELRA